MIIPGGFCLPGFLLCFFHPYFSKRREPVENDEKKETEEQNPMLGMMFKNIPPLLWEAALPILLRWGVGRIGNLFRRRAKR